MVKSEEIERAEKQTDKGLKVVSLNKIYGLWYNYYMTMYFLIRADERVQLLDGDKETLLPYAYNNYSRYLTYLEE